MNRMDALSSKRNALFILTLCFIVSVGCAISLVLVRQKTVTCANAAQELERTYVQLERKYNFLESRVAELHNPEQLARQMAYRLSVPQSRQVVWLAPGQAAGAVRTQVAQNISISQPRI